MPRRLAITGPYKVEIMEYEDPPLKENEVLIKTEYASGKHGTTTAMFDNRTFAGQRFDLEMRLFVPKEEEEQPKPHGVHGTGTTAVGMVVDVGSAVTKWKAGDRVIGLMDIRETNIRKEDDLWELGDIDPLLALCLEPAYRAFHAIRESNLRYGDTVAVIGLGALGLLTVRMAQLSGAEAIFAVDTLENRREWAAKNGADAVLDPRACDVGLEVHKLTGGKGVDVAIEFAGVYPALNTALRCVRIMGTVCSGGFYQGEAHGLFLGREWHHNRLTMVVPHGCGWGHPPRDFPRWDERRANDALVSLMRQGKLTAPGLIDPLVSLEEGPKVWDWIINDPGKVIKYGIRF